MHNSNVLFYEEKKIAVTNILDAAVKALEFDQKDCIRVKASVMEAIEKPGNENVGLAKVVSLTNKLISAVAEHSGYVIVDPVKQDESPELKIDPIEANITDANQTKVGAKEQGRATSSTPHVVVRNRESSKLLKKEPSSKGKEGILKLVRFLPPLISMQDVELVTAQICKAPFGAATGNSPARTTGDFEKELVEQVLAGYLFIYDDLVSLNNAAFMELIVMANGKEKEVDVSDKLRKKLLEIQTIAEFLSIKDMVDRLIKNYNKPTKKEVASKSSLFFWRKK